MNKLLLFSHFGMFFASFAIWFAMPHLIHVVSFVLIFICLYLILFNLNKREILPAMAIIVMTEQVKAAIAYYLSDSRLYHMIGYLLALTLICLAQSYLLFRYHAAPKIQQLFGVEFMRPYIPQVLAICMLSVGTAAIFAAMLVEVLIYAYDPTIFAGPPFFYRNSVLLTSITTGITIVALWSMMLDAHYLKARLDKLRGGSMKG